MEPLPDLRVVAPENVFDPGALENLLATLEDEGPQLVAGLIATFFEESPGLIKKLRDGLAAKDTDAVRTTAHSLKSSSAALGAVGLSGACREVEAAAKAGELDAGAAERVEAEYAPARDALEAVVVALERQRGA